MSSLRIETLRLCWLEALVTVADTENISEAARQLDISQPTVSRYLQALAQWCGYDLIDTLAISDPDDPRRSVGITERGWTLYENAKKVMELLSDCRTDDAIKSEIQSSILWIVDRIDSVIHASISIKITEKYPIAVAIIRNMVRSFDRHSSINVYKAAHSLSKITFREFDLDFDPESREKYKIYLKRQNFKTKAISAKNIRVP